MWEQLQRSSELTASSLSAFRCSLLLKGGLLDSLSQYLAMVSILQTSNFCPIQDSSDIQLLLWRPHGTALLGLDCGLLVELTNLPYFTPSHVSGMHVEGFPCSILLLPPFISH